MHAIVFYDYSAIDFSFSLLALKVGDRCQVEPGEKRGVVKFVGQAETLGPGFWVGVQYDEPLGKHDGMYVNFKLRFPNFKIIYECFCFLCCFWY